MVIFTLSLNNNCQIYVIDGISNKINIHIKLGEELNRTKVSVNKLNASNRGNGHIKNIAWIWNRHSIDAAVEWKLKRKEINI